MLTDRYFLCLALCVACCTLAFGCGGGRDGEGGSDGGSTPTVDEQVTQALRMLIDSDDAGEAANMLADATLAIFREESTLQGAMNRMDTASDAAIESSSDVRALDEAYRQLGGRSLLAGQSVHGNQKPVNGSRALGQPTRVIYINGIWTEKYPNQHMAATCALQHELRHTTPRFPGLVVDEWYNTSAINLEISWFGDPMGPCPDDDENFPKFVSRISRLGALFDISAAVRELIARGVDLREAILQLGFCGQAPFVEEAAEVWRADGLATKIRGHLSAGERVILLAHSQGNFFARDALRTLTSQGVDLGEVRLIMTGSPESPEDIRENYLSPGHVAVVRNTSDPVAKICDDERCTEGCVDTPSSPIPLVDVFPWHPFVRGYLTGNALERILHHISVFADSADGWLKQAGGAGSGDITEAVAAAHLPDGSCVVAGWFTGAAILGAGEPNITTLASLGAVDGFVAKYDESGSLLWARGFGGPGDDITQDVAVFPDGSCVVTGQFRDTCSFDTEMLTSAGRWDCFFARYDTNGAIGWARQAGSPGAPSGTGSANTGSDSGQGVDVFPDGSIALAGTHTGQAVFGPGEAGEVTVGGAHDGNACFAARYEGDGTFRWVRKIDGGGRQIGSRYAEGRGIAAHPDGSCTVTGFTTHSPFFDPLIVRLDTDGDPVWDRSILAFEVVQPADIAGFPDGSVVVTGQFYDSIAFPSAGGASGVLTAVGTSQPDLFVVRYGADGVLEWARRAGADGRDGGVGVATSLDGSFVLTATIRDVVEFQSGPAGSVMAGVDGSNEGVVARYTGDGFVSWVARLEGPGTRPAAATILSDASAIAVGYFSTEMLVPASSGDPGMLVSAGGRDGFLVRLDVEGQLHR